MAYNTVSLFKKMLMGSRYLNTMTRYWMHIGSLQGRNGANRVELHDADGNPIDLEALFTAIETILLAIKDTAGIKKIVDALSGRHKQYRKSYC